MTTREIADQIRAALLEAQAKERETAPFHLFGRGHEPRVVLDRTVGAIVRDIGLSREVISGYGAKYRYSRRVFKRAVEILKLADRTDAAQVLRCGYSECI